MSFGMGVTNSKFVKGGRKFKKTNIAPFQTLVRDESEKASKIRKRSYLLFVDNEKRKRYHNEEYVERCTKPDGKVRDLQSKEIKDA